MTTTATTTTPTWRSTDVRTVSAAGEERPVQGFVSDEVPGLAITPFQARFGVHTERWVVTHRPSGTRIGELSFSTFEFAQTAVLGILPLADWTQPAETLRARPAKEKRRLQSAIHRVMNNV